MERIAVRLPDREYVINIGFGLAEELAGFLNGLEGCRKVALISHPTLARRHHIHLDKLTEKLEAEGRGLHHILFPAGERHKNLNTVNRIYRELLALGLERSDAVVAWGGGVVGDLAGFAAASYMRGIRYVQVPTTLMAMVDSSIGGKVGVDLAQGKNLVGFFYQPAAVFCDMDLLSTLPRREYISGLGEVTKYALVFDPVFHAELRDAGSSLLERQGEGLAKAISTCAALKAGITEKDEHDLKGERIFLNYGHTFAHALEAVTAYRYFLHGEAVALGMRMAARLAEALEVAGPGLYQAHMELLEALELTGQVREMPGTVPAAERMVESMAYDKKREEGKPRLVLLEEVGKPVTLRLEPGREMASSIRAVLEEETGTIGKQGGKG